MSCNLFFVKNTAQPWISILIIGISFAPLLGWGQAPRFERVIEYGSPNWVRQVDMCLDSADNLYVGGTFEEIICFSDTCLYAPSQNGEDMYMVSFDSQGRFRWAKTFGEEDIDWLLAMALRGNQLYITGTFQQDLTIGDSTWTTANRGAFWYKFDLMGQPQQGIELAGGNVEHIVVDLEEKVWIAGYFLNDTLRVGDTVLVKDSTQVLDIFWARFNAEGEVEQAQMFGSQGTRWATNVYQMEVDSEGNLYLYAGFETNVIIGPDTLWSTTNTWNQADKYLVKLSPQGEIAWSRVGTPVSEMILDTQGRLIVTGNTNSSMTWGDSTIEAGYFLAALNADGNPDWVSQSPGITPNLFRVTDMTVKDNRIYSQMMHHGPAVFPDTSYYVEDKILVLRHSALTGELVWHKEFGEADVYETASDLLVTHHNSIVSAGSFDTDFQNYTYLDTIQVTDRYPIGGFGGWHYIGIAGPDTLLSTSLVSMEKQNRLVAFPNPVHDELYISGFLMSGIASIQLIDLHGRVILHQDAPITRDRLCLNVQDIASGVFLLHIHTTEINQIFRLIKQP